ncbi:MAG: sugar phosphate isomerase/epimerase family protein [Opitutaceae bacterium]|nr:sugar phosphate isomerase/epimerase family protein [Opitutaceae bacterium]
MQAGFSSYAVGWTVSAAWDEDAPTLDAFGVVDLALELGYGRVQLADNVPLHSLSAAERDALQRKARETGIAIEIGTRGLTVENVRRYVEIAATFRSPFLRIVLDPMDCEPSPDSVIALLRTQVSLLEHSGVVLAIENHDRFKSDELARILTEVDSPWVRICLDTANSFGAGEDVTTVVRHLAAYTVNVHLKDVRIRRVSSLQGFTIEGVPLGEGIVPIEWVIRELARHRCCRTATLEHWVPPEPDVADTARKEREWCVRSTATMRRLFPGSFGSVQHETRAG